MDAQEAEVKQYRRRDPVFSFYQAESEGEIILGGSFTFPVAVGDYVQVGPDGEPISLLSAEEFERQYEPVMIAAGPHDG